MSVEKVFGFLLILISLLVGVFILQKEIFPQNPKFKEITEETKSQYLMLKEMLEKIRPETSKNWPETSAQPDVFLRMAFSEEQRIGQLFIVGIEGTEVGTTTENLIKNFYPGGVILLGKNIRNPEQLKKLIADLQNLSLTATGLPLFIAVDQEGGVVDRIGFLHEKTSQSKIATTEQASQVGFSRAQELKELGVNLNLAPLLDDSQPGDFIYERAFQREVATLGDLASALVSGQKQAGILTAIKHFPGYGGIGFNPEEKLAAVQEIPEISQFKKVINNQPACNECSTSARPDLVMSANVLYQELDSKMPFSFSSTSVQFLKANLGEEVVLISDDLAQSSLLKQFSLSQIVTLPFQAGIDVLLFSGWRHPVEPAILAFKEALKSGAISQEKIDQSVIKIIELKSKLYTQF